jgi:CPA1 family monovalent cation:H+ antiporter
MNGVQLLLVLVGAIAVTGLAQRRGLESTLVIVIVAGLASFIPGMPRLELEPDIILGLVLPPLLYSAALNFSFFNFVQNLRPILALGIGLVLLTTVAVGFFAYWIVPAMSLGAALLLGSIVAPPDAVTAVAIGRKLGLPKRMMSILVGESLVNDAAALTLFAITAAAITGTHTLFSNPILLFLYDAIVGAIVGIILGQVAQWLRVRLENSALETVLGLVVPFAAYLAAEQVEASGVLAVVMAGFTLGIHSTQVSYTTRLQERQVWDSLDVLLEAFVFAYMGLQLRFVIDDVVASGESPWIIFGTGGLVLLVVMLVRPVGVFPLFGLGALGFKIKRKRLEDPKAQKFKEEREARFAARKEKRQAAGKPRRGRGGLSRKSNEPLTWQQNLVISWTGMRGVVTLAAAAGTPLVTPGRDAILAIAFVVAIGTLLIQGTTLPALISALNIADPSEAEFEKQETSKAQKISQEASREVIAKFVADPPPGVDPEILNRFQQMATRQEHDDGEAIQARQMGAAFRDLRQETLTAQREAIIRERNEGRLDDDVARTVIEQLDYQEAASFSNRVDRL